MKDKKSEILTKNSLMYLNNNNIKWIFTVLNVSCSQKNNNIKI